MAAAKKSTAKPSRAKQPAAKQAAATKSAATNAPAKKTAAKKAPAKKAPAKKAPAKRAATKAAAKQPGAQYTKPELRERLKAEITAGDKGGKPGQWSARKAQLLAHEYEAAGGGYRGGPSPAQRHLHEWTEEEWTTKDGAKAERPGGTRRYLPREAWEKLSPAERAATDEKKRAGSRRGRQFVDNTPPAREARKSASAAKRAR